MIEDASAPAEAYDPVELYDAVHRLHPERTGGDVDGRLVHLAWPTADGLRVVEVWDSREQYDRHGREDVGPLAAGVLAGRPWPTVVVTRLDVRGLVVPAGGVVVPAGGAARCGGPPFS
ncbi:hypothetical protein SAMN05660464_4105 [Geodermatophilus dictyosporus]|uniref:Antibiotic biosynthesis monooxygenase n=1 Tax=Geodermatophilus dictyosporus TaxID=1523247 RepID=A0A1I5SX11_9ACTN|nr:hypothetical protein [Geodermatophilus dictyosporus]SFP75248.1 hypothetical protein SAMN05660464_4105 [Geodermatophilus dictyosporus]